MKLYQFSGFCKPYFTPDSVACWFFFFSDRKISLLWGNAEVYCQANPALWESRCFIFCTQQILCAILTGRAINPQTWHFWLWQLNAAADHPWAGAVNNFSHCETWTTPRVFREKPPARGQKEEVWMGGSVWPRSIGAQKMKGSPVSCLVRFGHWATSLRAGISHPENYGGRQVGESSP